MSQETAAARAWADDAQYVTFGVGAEIFAAPVTQVREVLDLCPITRIPHAPPFMRGMISVRGKGIPVVDMRLKFGLPATEPTPHTRILVLEVAVAGRTLAIGALTDQVYEVTPLDSHEVEAPPEIGRSRHADFIRGLGRRNDAFVLLLDLDRLFSADDIVLDEGLP